MKLNSILNWPSIKQEYTQDKRLQVQDWLEPSSATELADSVSNIAFNLAITQQRKPGELTQQQLRMLNNHERQALFEQVHKDAANGIGFVYERSLITAKNQNTPVLIRSIHELMNSSTVIEKIKDLSGYDDITHASMQATAYRKGCFLTRHNDINPNEGRRVAYVINLTRNWHPDWGGLLQFYHSDGTPRDAWAPKFNSLSLFDVKHVHAVTYVTPFANSVRYALTGWFRAF